MIGFDVFSYQGGTGTRTRRVVSDQSSKSSSLNGPLIKSFFFWISSFFLSSLGWFFYPIAYSVSRKTIRPPGRLNSSCNIVTKLAK
jgi:hypothetical protein